MKPSAVPVLRISGEQVVRFGSLSEAAKLLNVSRYTLLTCYFTETPLPDGAWIDLDLSVGQDVEHRLRKTWLYTRKTSERRRKWDR